MRIAVLSGKGGTGKTLVSVNVAAVAESATYIDCDVEEPNGHLFFKPEGVQEELISVKIPTVDTESCNGSRKCVDFCAFNALAYSNNKLIIFEDVCHSCGGCLLVCPEQALSERDRVIGKVQRGHSGAVTIVTGLLNTGEESGTPIIKNMLAQDRGEETQLTIVDCPPGTACIVMDSIKEADYCILVAEPTVFGVHNLNMVYDLVRLFELPFGVVLNKHMDGENPAKVFCQEKGITVLGTIPFDTELGTINSNAEIAATKHAQYHRLFSQLLFTTMKEARRETATHPER